MCNHETETEAQIYLAEKSLTRRHFGSLAAAIGLAVSFAGCSGGTQTNAQIPASPSASPSSGADDLIKSDVIIDTPDGNADAYFVTPNSGKHPAVIIWTDIRGLRSAFKLMGERLAKAGYSVLVVNPFYRGVSGAEMEAKIASLPQSEVRSYIFGFARATSAATNRTDAAAYINWLDGQNAVDTSRKIGVMGYCYGGPITLRVAAMFPERVGAGGSFHGASLVTDAADSPHLGASKMNAEFLIAIADNDDQKEPQAKVKLKQAFDAASSSAEIEVYTDAQHGWCPPDSQVYHEAQAERAWERLLVTFGRALT